MFFKQGPGLQAWITKPIQLAFLVVFLGLPSCVVHCCMGVVGVWGIDLIHGEFLEK